MRLAPAVVPGLLLPSMAAKLSPAQLHVRNILAAPMHKRYERYASLFVSWCFWHRFASFPATDETVVLFLEDLFDGKTTSTCKSVNHLRMYFTAIRALHFMNGETCGSTGLVQSFFRKLVKTGPLPKWKEPFTSEQVDTMCDLALAKHDLWGLRDCAMCRLLYAAALRTIECATLVRADVSIEGSIMIVRIVNGKTKKGSLPDYIYVRAAADPWRCPIAAMVRYLAASGIVDGPLFRGILPGQRLTGAALTTTEIRNRVKKYVAEAGFEGDYSCYSHRHGAATTAADNGAPIDNIRHHLRHRHLRTTRRYIHSKSNDHGIRTDRYL